MITEVILYHNKYADLKATINSIVESEQNRMENVQVLVCNSTEEKIDGVILNEIREKTAKIEELKLDLISFAEQYQVILSKLQAMGTKYVHFVQAGDVLSKDAIAKVVEKREELGTEEKVIAMKLPANGSKVRTKRDDKCLDLNKSPYDAPLALNQFIIFSSTFEKY